MTTDDTKGQESKTNHRLFPANEKKEGDIDAEKTTNLAELPEGSKETELQTQQVKDRTEAEPAKEGLAFHFGAPNPTASIDKDEADGRRLLMEEEVTHAVAEGAEILTDVQTTETGDPKEIDNLESDSNLAARVLVDPPEQQSTLSALASSKEAVQDPGVVDIAPPVADNGVIDVDTFDDEVSGGNESDSSPDVDETMAEVDNANEQSNDEPQGVHDIRNEPIDLTASPPIKSQESPMFPENDEKMITEAKAAMKRRVAIDRQGVIDVDEPEGQKDGNDTIEGANRRIAVEDIHSPLAEDGEKHIRGTTDTETVSADLNADFNGEDVSPGEVPAESSALVTAESEVESRLALERAGVTDQDLDDERSPRRNRMGSEDDALEPQGQERVTKTIGGINFMEASVRKPDSESGQRSVAQEESEDDESEDDVASEPLEQEHDENEAVEDGSPSGPSETTGSENEGHDKTPSTPQNENLLEEIPDKDTCQRDADKHVGTCRKDEEATSQLNEVDEKTARPSNDDMSAIDPMNEDDIATVTSDGEPQPAEKSDRAEQDASAIEVADLEESTMVDAETGDIDVSHTARTFATRDAVLQEPSNVKQMQASAPGSDLPLSREDNREDSGEDVITGSAERATEGITSAHTVAASITEAHTHASTPQDRGPSRAERGTDGGTEAAPVYHMSTSSASETVKQTPSQSEKNLVEENKNAGIGHLAPMFGIQLSRPIKSGPVTFSSPPSFPRYSLNPQAVPFLPAKVRKHENNQQPIMTSETPSETVTTPTSETKATDRNALHTAVDRNEEKAMEADDVADKNMEIVPTPSLSMKSSSAVTTSQISVDKAPPPVASTEPAKETPKETSAQLASQNDIASAAKPSMKPSLKKMVQKKVSFALKPTEIEDPGPEKEHTAEAQQVLVAHKGQENGGLAEQPGLQDAKAESRKPSKTGKSLVEVGGVKEKQRILQVQTDEGLRREVKNVTVAMREGNSKVRPERKKFTVRLTTGNEEKAKLQFFKVTGSSLKLYASLDASRENLRVRKVTNRQYVMSVAKVAPPGDDTADIIVKYFLHFEEQNTFEEMYSQCVSNLQRQPKPTIRAKKASEGSKISHTSSEEMRQDTKRMSPKSAGVKRSAETVSALQASKKSKLLADKKKLLDKMAALRRKKEQKMSAGVKERQTQPVAEAATDAHGYDASDKGAMCLEPAGSLKIKDVETKPKGMELGSSVTQETTARTERDQPPRKRTAEDMSKEYASKRARLPGMHSTNDATGKSLTPLPDGKSRPLLTSATNMHGAASKGKEPSSDIGKSSLMSGANPSRLHNISSQKHARGISSEQTAPSVDTAKEQKLRETEAMRKVTRDLKKSEDEKKALQVELDSRNRLIDAEREKSLREQTENSSAWQRIVETVEALSDDMRRLRKEDTDRSLESLARCEASSSEDFFDRLHTFRPSTWAAFENSDIGALECALRGWYNQGPGKIRSSEGSEITLSESFDDANFRQGEIERVRSLLREGHCLLSGWIGQSCPETFRTLKGSQRMLTKEALRANVEGLREGQQGSKTKYEWGANALLLSDDICEKLAVYNWSMDGECLRCSWCNRRVVVEDESRFDARSKHYAFCPFRAEDWKGSVLRNAAILGIEGDGDAVMKD